MSTIFTRIKETISADIHQILDEKEQKNPISTLNHYLRQAEKEKQKVKKTLERQYRLKDNFTREYHEADDRAKKRLAQAKIAEAADEQDLYSFAMKEYEEYTSRATRMKDAREQAVSQIDYLERKYQEMNHKLKDMHLKQMELMGRENVAKANHQMNKVLHDNHQPLHRFNELERYIENIENRVNQAYYESTFDEKIARLEKELQNNKE